MTPVKWTIVNGEWVQRPATEIDGQHPYATGKDRDTKQAERARVNAANATSLHQ